MNGGTLKLTSSFVGDVPTPNSMSCDMGRSSSYKVSRLGFIEAGMTEAMLRSIAEPEREALDGVSLELLRRILERKRLEDETAHAASLHPDLAHATIDFLLVALLEAVYVSQMPLPASVLVLARERLGG